MLDKVIKVFFRSISGLTLVKGYLKKQITIFTVSKTIKAVQLSGIF